MNTRAVFLPRLSFPPAVTVLQQILRPGEECRGFCHGSLHQSRFGQRAHGAGIDQATGGLTPVPGSPFATPAQPAPLVIDPSGKYLYSVNTGDNSVSSFAINATTGALSLVNTVAAGVSPRFPELVALQ